ncbi:Glycosyl transferases group 1, partial [Candidatus Kryptonium thompsonii]
ELIKLFREVDVCVYPSIYEGFGLPPLEAMASGCPVIVSGNSSLPEVVGEAGLTINPYDPKEMASAIVRVLKDTNLKKQMSLLGIERAKALDLEKNLGELIKLIKSLK